MMKREQAVHPASPNHRASRQTVQREPARPGLGGASQVLALQRAVGNRATRQLLVQAKLTVGPVDDVYEREADQVAHQVVRRLHAPEVASGADPVVQRQAEAHGGVAVSPQVEGAIARARGGGQALPPSVRQPMESAFGADFAGVRVHTGAEADTLNRSLAAQAFTTGRDVFFRQGAYDPGSRAGQGLLAHELTHVVQQNTNGQLVQRAHSEYPEPPLPEEYWYGKFPERHSEYSETPLRVPNPPLSGKYWYEKFLETRTRRMLTAALYADHTATRQKSKTSFVHSIDLRFKESLGFSLESILQDVEDETSYVQDLHHQQLIAVESLMPTVESLREFAHQTANWELIKRTERILSEVAGFNTGAVDALTTGFLNTRENYSTSGGAFAGSYGDGGGSGTFFQPERLPAAFQFLDNFEKLLEMRAIGSQILHGKIEPAAAVKTILEAAQSGMQTAAHVIQGHPDATYKDALLKTAYMGGKAAGLELGVHSIGLILALIEFGEQVHVVLDKTRRKEKSLLSRLGFGSGPLKTNRDAVELGFRGVNLAARAVIFSLALSAPVFSIPIAASILAAIRLGRLAWQVNRHQRSHEIFGELFRQFEETGAVNTWSIAYQLSSPEGKFMKVPTMGEFSRRLLAERLYYVLLTKSEAQEIQDEVERLPKKLQADLRQLRILHQSHVLRPDHKIEVRFLRRLQKYIGSKVT